MNSNYNLICDRFPDLDDIRLINESSLDPSRRTYIINDLIIKSRKIDEDRTSHLRMNDLKQEYGILISCDRINGIPKALQYCKNISYEIMILEYLPGIQLVNLNHSFRQIIRITIELCRILNKMSLKGICHNDVVPENVLVKENLSVCLIDFDQAVTTKPIRAFAGNFFGFKVEKSKVSFSLITIFKYYIKQKFPRLVITIKRLLGRGYSKELMKLPEIKEDSDSRLLSLLKAWKLAQQSNASSPGVLVAYYTLDFMGYRFPGERPWEDRWNKLKNISEFSGKTIIELGCNMGLLSTHLLKEANAKRCVAIDNDEKILKSAKIISEVFGVKPEYHQIDLDSYTSWEDKLLEVQADIIFVLNVFNWIKNKQRFLLFLSKFPEVIFEGHDSPQIEKSRYEELGFTKIEEIGYSERERIILRCRK